MLNCSSVRSRLQLSHFMFSPAFLRAILQRHYGKEKGVPAAAA
jgi:hypothetical protein